MPMTLDQFTAEAHRLLKAEPGPAGREKVCALVQQALKDPAFVAANLRADGPERKVLYEDPELGFTVLAHAYQGAKDSKPHDHGPSWAIYGQAAGETIMTDWDCLARPSADRTGQGAAQARLRADPGHGLSLQRGRPAFTAARRRDRPAAHRRAEHGPGEAPAVRGGGGGRGLIPTTVRPARR